MRVLMWLIGLVIVAGLGLFAALKIGGPDLIYPRVPGVNYGPSSIAFTDTDPGKTIGGTILLGRAQDETGVDMYMVHWGLEVGKPGQEDDAGQGDHGGLCKGFRDTGHVAMAPVPKEPGTVLSLTIPPGTPVPEGAVYLVGHTIHSGIHNLAKCVQVPIVNVVQ